MRRAHVAVALLMTSGIPVLAAGQGRYLEPWDAATEAAAEAAVRRLNGKIALELRVSVLHVPALTERLSAIGTRLVASVEQVRQALTDLGARETAVGVQVDLPADVLFDFDKADIRPEATPTLEKVAMVLGNYRRSHVLIEGHTDGKGAAAYNQALSERRASAIRAWLQSRVPDEIRLEIRGLGATKPVASNTNQDGSDNPDGRRQNRRVRIVIRKAP